MTMQKSRTSNSRAGVKILLAVAAVGCTVGGWMYFAGAAPADTATSATQPAQITTTTTQPLVVLPTLVPIDDALSASKSVSAMPQAQAPQPQVRRSVSLPQPPMAMSRSSR